MAAQSSILTIWPKPLKSRQPKTKLSAFRSNSLLFLSCFQSQHPKNHNPHVRRKNGTHRIRPIIATSLDEVSWIDHQPKGGLSRSEECEEEEEDRGDLSYVGRNQMLGLCGFGYWVQGFRCFPWLALNFHMAHNLSLYPSTLQLVQNAGNLPMVAKPLYGILSDAFYIAGAHRIPYISAGVLLQILAWGGLALNGLVSEALPTLLACVLLSNMGASLTEVANDALVAEYGHKQGITGLQSYAFMASAVGGILGNLAGGYVLLRAPPRAMFLIFSALLSIQLVMSLSWREESLGLAQASDHCLPHQSITERIRKQLSDLKIAINDESISQPLSWIVASIATVPLLSASIFCYQTQCLQLDSSVIGMSRVVGQLMLLLLTVLYDRYWRKMSMRKLIGITQFLYAAFLLLDLVLVIQVNVQLGIHNELFVLCYSGLAETLAQFKLLPFSVLLASLCPQGCEGSLTSFLASALCLSSIVSGFLGIGLASMLGITAGDYSSLPVGILIQFVAALLPLGWIHRLSTLPPAVEKERKRGLSKRARRNRRVGRIVVGSIFVYRRERESEASN